MRNISGGFVVLCLFIYFLYVCVFFSLFHYLKNERNPASVVSIATICIDWSTCGVICTEDFACWIARIRERNAFELLTLSCGFLKELCHGTLAVFSVKTIQKFFFLTFTRAKYFTLKLRIETSINFFARRVFHGTFLVLS